MSPVAVAAEPIKMMRREKPNSLPLSKFQTSEYAYASFSATLPVGTQIEDTLKPEFWAHVCHLLQKQPVTGEPELTGAIIEVRTEDHAFHARLYVRAVQERGLLVEIMKPDNNGISWFGPKEIRSDNYKIKWNIGKLGYDIVRNSDNEIVATDLKTKEEAQAWLDESVT